MQENRIEKNTDTFTKEEIKLSTLLPEVLYGIAAFLPAKDIDSLRLTSRSLWNKIQPECILRTRYPNHFLFSSIRMQPSIPRHLRALNREEKKPFINLSRMDVLEKERKILFLAFLVSSAGSVYGRSGGDAKLFAAARERQQAFIDSTPSTLSIDKINEMITQYIKAFQVDEETFTKLEAYFTEFLLYTIQSSKKIEVEFPAPRMPMGSFYCASDVSLSAGFTSIFQRTIGQLPIANSYLEPTIGFRNNISQTLIFCGCHLLLKLTIKSQPFFAELGMDGLCNERPLESAGRYLNLAAIKLLLTPHTNDPGLFCSTLIKTFDLARHNPAVAKEIITILLKKIRPNELSEHPYGSRLSAADHCRHFINHADDPALRECYQLVIDAAAVAIHEEKQHDARMRPQ